MRDFYNRYDPYAVTEEDKKKYQDYLARLSAEERAIGRSWNKLLHAVIEKQRRHSDARYCTDGV